jgi:hypothetical protein
MIEIWLFFMLIFFYSISYKDDIFFDKKTIFYVTDVILQFK